MRLTVIFAMLLGVSVLTFLSNAEASAEGGAMREVAAEKSVKKATCKFETNDLGTIIGRGPTSEDAFEDAATKCFEARRSLYKAKNKGQSVDTETGELYIDVCVNMKCS